MLQCRTSVAALRGATPSIFGRPVALMVLLAGLIGCGQKGPLTLVKPLPSAPAASSPAPAR
jgi:predicted small lipoprotein YifL